MSEKIYSRRPILIHGEIPVFSPRDEYVQTYEKIAKDHLLAFEEGIENPWIGKEALEKIERSTYKTVIKWSNPGDTILVLKGAKERARETLAANRPGESIEIEVMS